jgi:hypothetical protein
LNSSQKLFRDQTNYESKNFINNQKSRVNYSNENTLLIKSNKDSKLKLSSTINKNLTHVKQNSTFSSTKGMLKLNLNTNYNNNF